MTAPDSSELRVRRTLGSKLLLLLLAFGVIPLALTSILGHAVSRNAILDQAHRGLEALTQTHALHFGTELDRERLLLKTIASQLPDVDAVRRLEPEAIAVILKRSLLDDGVFDGLRLATEDGRVLAVVALRESEPRWPAIAPAADWSTVTTWIHRDGGQAVAYLVVAPVGDGAGLWLEGHVRSEDFRKILEAPEHLLDEVESAIIGPDGQPIFGFHEHSAQEVALLVENRSHAEAESATDHAGAESLIAISAIPGSSWTFATTTPIDVALTPLSRLRDKEIVGTLVLVLLIAVTAIVSARSVTTPLRELAHATSALGRDEPFRPLSSHSHDELGTLVESFNAMATSVAQSREEVERLHAQEMERAQQLASVGELASGIAHEIRNPLTGVRGALDLALRRIPEDDSARTLLVESQQQLARIENSMKQFLQYARPPVLKELVVDASLLVERAVAIVGPRAASAGVGLTVEASPDPLELHVDSELIVQVLVNLLLNALDASPAGASVAVWTARHAPEVWIGVRDAGPGVDQKHRDDIFRPFFTTKHQGTGLGLSISRQIVTRHKGTLTVESPEGGGATFVLALPLTEKE